MYRSFNKPHKNPFSVLQCFICVTLLFGLSLYLRFRHSVLLPHLYKLISKLVGKAEIANSSQWKHAYNKY